VDEEPRRPGSEKADVTPSHLDEARRTASARFEAVGTFGMLGSVGLSFVLALVIGTALGYWLDKLTGWSPVFFIVFFVLGLAAGIRNVYVTTKKYMK
jgi:ATP synthase protein I